MSEYNITLQDNIVLGGGGGGEGLLRDRLIIPDIYNTGCHGTLTKFDVSTDTSGIIWRDNTTKMDFIYGKAVKNLSANQVITFENIDFTDYPAFSIVNAEKYLPTDTDYRDNLKFVFKNCLFREIDQNAWWDSEVNIQFEFYDCKTRQVKVGNAILDRCQIGDITWFNATYGDNMTGDGINPTGYLTIKNSYIFDLEQHTESSGGEHIDGYQFGNGARDQHLINCRFECYDMPYDHSQGGWSYNVYFEKFHADSSIEYSTFNGGGDYGMAIYKSNEDGSEPCENFVWHDNQITRYYNNGGAFYLIDVQKHRLFFDKNENGGFGKWTNTILVSSVWVEDGKIKICWSNDLDSERTLSVVTDTEVTYTETIPACPIRSRSSSAGITQWSDLPFDRIFEIDVYGVHDIKIYDSGTLIRTFVVDMGESKYSEEPNLGTKTITGNGTYTAASDNLDGYSSVTVEVPEPTGTIEITENGIVDVSDYASADVSVSSSLPSYLFVNDQTLTADTETYEIPYDGTKTVMSLTLYMLDTVVGTNTAVGAMAKRNATNTNYTWVLALTDGNGNESTTSSYGGITFDTDNNVIKLGTRTGRPYKNGKSYRAIVSYVES